MQLLTLTAGMALLGPGAATAADPPGWTTVPDSDNSFGWEVPRPAQKPQPQPSFRTPVRTPADTTPVAQPAPTRQRAHHPRAKHRKQQAPMAIRRNVVIVTPDRTGAVLAAHVSTSRAAYESALLVAALGLAIACFACGAAPTTQTRWRRGATFVADQRANITTAGVLFLLAAAIVFELTRP